MLDFSKLREPILIIFGLEERGKYVLSCGGVFVVFSTSAFWDILKKRFFIPHLWLEILISNSWLLPLDGVRTQHKVDFRTFHRK